MGSSNFSLTPPLLATVQVSRLSRSPVQVRKPMRRLAMMEMGISIVMGVPQWMDQWPFQDPKLEVPTIYKAYIRPM